MKILKEMKNSPEKTQHFPHGAITFPLSFLKFLLSDKFRLSLTLFLTLGFSSDIPYFWE